MFECVDNSPCVVANNENLRFTTPDKNLFLSAHPPFAKKEHGTCDLCINFLLLIFCFLELFMFAHSFVLDVYIALVTAADAVTVVEIAAAVSSPF